MSPDIRPRSCSISNMFKLFSRKEKKESPPRKNSAKYIYKPYENAMAYRVEHREGVAYVYPGWSRSPLFKIEGEKIYPTAEENPVYIIIGRDVFNADCDKKVCIISGSRVLDPGGKKILYEIRDSITVQGTL